jgi:hypothetical protein
MPSDSLYSRSVEHAARVWPLAAVPLVVTLFDVGRLRTLLRNTDRAFSVTFGVPRPVSSLFSFVNAQPNGVSGFGSVAVFAVALVGSAVVSGLLAAGYLGSIDAALDGRIDFLGAVRSYGRPLVGFSLLEAAVTLTFVGMGIVAPPLLVVFAVGFLVLAYLFFATPYLVVVAELTLASALRRSVELATGDGRVLGFFLGYVLVSAILSVPISMLAFSSGLVGVAAAVVASTPAALLLNVATLLFVRDLVAEPASPTQSSNMPVDM